MLTEGLDVIVIEDHVAGNPFQNSYSEARHSYYGGGGVPSAWFDGVLNSLGGMGSGSMYSYYLPLFNERIAIPSNFTVAMNGFNDGSDFTVLVTIENVEPYEGDNLVLQFTLTESHIPHNWGSLTEANHVNRFMAPDEFGTPLDFSSNSTQSIILEFSVDPSWVIENCELVAFVQDNTTKEILQGAKVAVPDLAPMYYNNASSQAINMVPVINTSGEVAPRVTVANEGADALTSVDINYMVNEESLNTFSWTGSLAYGETAQVDLPAVAFGLAAENELVVYTTDPNGSTDEDNSNDTIVTNFNSSTEIVDVIHMYLKLDDNPQETTWEVLDSNGDVVYSGGPYSEPLEYIQETFNLSKGGFFTYIIYDEAGDGLADPGFYQLRKGDYSMYYENQNFVGSEELVQFAVVQTSVTPIDETEGFAVYPNPFEDYTYVTFNMEESVNVDLTVYNIIGEVVYSASHNNLSVGSQKLEINTQDFTPGVYFVNIVIGDKVYTKKISSK